MSNSLLTLQEKPAAGFDVARLREDFPILAREIHGKPLVYLDNAASAQKPKPVLDAMAEAYAETYANVHRGAHFLSSASTVAFENARETARRFINAPRVAEIILTKGGTEAINLAASCLGATLSEGDEIILSEMEHHSNIVPWHFLRERYGVVLRWAPLNADDSFDIAAFAKLLTARTKLVAVTHMSNVLGTITPLSEIIRLAHAAGAKTSHRWLPGVGASTRRCSGARLRLLRRHRPQALRPHGNWLSLRKVRTSETHAALPRWR